MLESAGSSGAKKATLAVAATMLGALDLGADHFARRDKAKTIGGLVRQLRDLVARSTSNMRRRAYY
jgi:hypothetical protein